MRNRQKRTRQFKHEIQTAVLLQGFEWGASTHGAVLGPGVTLSPTAASPVGHLYHKLCANTGVDDGEPFGYEVHAVLTPTDDDPSVTSFRYPQDRVNRLCNVVAVITGSAVGMYRVIWSEDQFRTATGTQLVHASDNLSLEPDKDPKLTDRLLSDLRVAWESCRRGDDRVTRALTQLHFAWRSPCEDQTCLHLGLAIRTLLAGDGGDAPNTEIAHRAACLLGARGDHREPVCISVEHLLTLQSQIARGDRVEGEELTEATVRGFTLAARLLRTVLLDPALIEAMGDDGRRVALFRGRTTDAPLGGQGQGAGRALRALGLLAALPRATN